MYMYISYVCIYVYVQLFLISLIITFNIILYEYIGIDIQFKKLYNI